MRRQTALMDVCPTCGRPLDEHNKNVRFRLPDPVLAKPGWGKLDGTWMSDADPQISVMMQVPEVGAFVRCLLPVHLTEGHTVTFGVWLGVHPDDLRHAFEQWWAPTYSELRLEGHLANALPGWGLLAVPATAAVVDADATPHIVASSDPGLAAVLDREWAHSEVLARLP